MSTDLASEIERLASTELSQNVALSRSAGWQDSESEWRVLHEAADVRGLRREQRVVAQVAFGDYGTCATIAKMVVAAEAQRQGWGGRLLDGCIAEAEARGIPLGLCATDQGRPLYESRGFTVSGELMILFGRPDWGTEADDSVVPLLDAERALEYDLRFSGCDRRRMLRARFREAIASFEAQGEARGFGLATAQGENALVGPILAESEQGARALLRAIFKAVDRPLRLDVPLQHVELRRWLVQLGLREMSVRVEMARGAGNVPWQSPQRFALATQAWG